MRLVVLSEMGYGNLAFGLATTARLAAPQPSVVSLLMELRHVLRQHNLHIDRFSAPY